jgi:hypothetical protein
MAKTVFDNTPCGKGMGFVPQAPAPTRPEKSAKSFEKFRKDILEGDADPELERLRRHRESSSRR